MIMAAPLPRTLLQYEQIFFPLTDLDTEWKSLKPAWKGLKDKEKYQRLFETKNKNTLVKSRLLGCLGKINSKLILFTVDLKARESSSVVI